MIKAISSLNLDRFFLSISTCQMAILLPKTASFYAKSDDNLNRRRNRQNDTYSPEVTVKLKWVSAWKCYTTNAI